MEQAERRSGKEQLCGRREHCNMFDDELIEKIAEKAAEKAVEKLTANIYQEIGKGVVTKALYILGALTVALWTYLKLGGNIK